MVQLHFDEKRLYTILDSRDILGDKYYDVFVEFFNDLEADNRVKSLATKILYMGKLRQFLLWLKERNIDPDDVDEKTLKEYMIHLKYCKKVTPGTVEVYVRVLRRFLTLIGKEHLKKTISYPKQADPVYCLPEPEIVEKIIADIRNLKYKTIVAMLYETGARISEILSIRMEYVKEEPEGYFRIIIGDTKTGNTRTVFVIKYAYLLRMYINTEKPETWLFPSPSRNGPLHPRNVEKLLARYRRKYGLKQLHPHLLRHLRGTLDAKEGLQERIIMQKLGHRSEKMMRVYINLAARDLEDVLLAKYGIRKIRGQKQIRCPKCGAVNYDVANYCWRCGLPLKAIAAYELEEKKKQLKTIMEQILNYITKHPEALSEIRKILAET